MSNICLCKGISEDTIIKAIKDGAITFEVVKEKTGAGTGHCHAARCKNKIEDLIKANK